MRPRRRCADVHVVPDFISNAGGVLISIVDGLGGSEADLFRILDSEIARITKRNLTDASASGAAPRAHEIRIGRERLLAARCAAERPSIAALQAEIRSRFGL